MGQEWSISSVFYERCTSFEISKWSDLVHFHNQSFWILMNVLFVRAYCFFRIGALFSEWMEMACAFFAATKLEFFDLS